MDPSSISTQDDLKLNDYSASATLTPFDRPLPLLRQPHPASHRDDPTAGPCVLAFKDLRSWASAYRRFQSKIVQQCEEGARIGCAISASKSCAQPWWEIIIGRKVDLKEREECEVREMDGCLVAAKEKCVGFAKDKCLKPFMEARIGVGGRKMLLSEKLARDLICRISMPIDSSKRDLVGLSWLPLDESVVTNVKIFEEKQYLLKLRVGSALAGDIISKCLSALHNCWFPGVEVNRTQKITGFSFGLS